MTQSNLFSEAKDTVAEEIKIISAESGPILERARSKS